MPSVHNAAIGLAVALFIVATVTTLAVATQLTTAAETPQVQQQTGGDGLGERGQQWERVFLIIAIVGLLTLIALLLYLVLKFR